MCPPNKIPQRTPVLKSILWEAILTTLVIAFLTSLAGKKINGEIIDLQMLIVPAGILLIALSLYFLKKGEPH